ncbi:unnamed protein product [Caenorhabditis brenneri]
MNSRSSKRRGGDKTNEIPSKKMVPGVLEAAGSVKYDVTIVVKGKRFQCRKEELSNHSNYFERMFSSNFTERNETEVELGIVKPESFDMFLKAIRGEDVLTDATVEKMLKLADYLESATLEASCMRHLAAETVFSLKQQFQMAETYHAKKLMIQVCSSIKDAYELDEVVPKDLDSFCNTTKNIVMQRSFELLGIRKPPSPPLSEDPDQVFEHMINQIVDQVEVQNHHGEVLKDQVYLLVEHVFMEMCICGPGETARGVFRDDPLINELLEQLRDAHEQEEKNFIHAQIQVVKLKHFYTRFQNPEFIVNASFRDMGVFEIPGKLAKLSAMLNRDERSQSRSQKLTLGSREIDEIYRAVTMEEIRNSQAEPPRNVDDNAVWIQDIDEMNDSLKLFLNATQHLIQQLRPINQREVSNRASFRIIDEIIHNARDFFYRSEPN